MKTKSILRDSFLLTLLLGIISANANAAVKIYEGCLETLVLPSAPEITYAQFVNGSAGSYELKSITWAFRGNDGIDTIDFAATLNTGNPNGAVSCNRNEFVPPQELNLRASFPKIISRQNGDILAYLGLDADTKDIDLQIRSEEDPSASADNFSSWLNNSPGSFHPTLFFKTGENEVTVYCDESSIAPELKQGFGSIRIAVYRLK